MITTIEDFIREYTIIKSSGWIKTHRAGSTGIGKTLEDLLGIPENNLDEPDFGEYELKSCRINSKSMLTMLTKAPQPAKANSYLCQKYGYIKSNRNSDKKILHEPLYATKFVNIADTGRSLKVVYDETKISIASDLEVENVYWDRETLREAFDKKYKGQFVYAKAENRGKGKNEEFWFKEAYIVSGFSYDSMIKLLEQGKICVDVRIGQYPNGKTHDHGTGFRISAGDQYLLFKNINKIV